MIRSIMLVLLLAFSARVNAAETPTLETPYPDDPMQVTIHRLDNGLTIYLSPNRQEPRVAAWIAVRAGGKHDPADSTGMAHYLEHMLFKGTPSLGTMDYEKEKPHLDKIKALYEKLFTATEPKARKEIYKEIDTANIAAAMFAAPNEIAKAYKQMGFRGLNAFTSVEQTVYICNFPSNRAEAWAKLESERFARPVFRLFQGEIEIVYEEKNRSMDNAEWILEETLDKMMFKKHPYGTQTVIGSIEHLKNPSLAKMYAYFDRHYIPNNMAIALSGDFDRQEMLALLKRTFGAWKPKPLPAPQRWEMPALQGSERTEIKYEAEEKVVLAWLLPSNRHADREALMVMDMLMDNSAAGLINLRLNQAQKVKAAGSGYSDYNDAGRWLTWALPKKGQTLEEAEKLLLETIESLKAGEFNEADMKAVQTDYEINQKKRLESNDARVSLITGSYIEERPWRETVESLSRLRRVTKDDVLRVARKYIGPDRVIVYRRNAKPEIPRIAKPEFTKLDINTSLESAFYKEIMALPAPVLEPRWLVEGRDYSLTQLTAGPLTTVANPYNDLFSLSLRFELGSRHERNLCAALDLLELSGAGSLSAEELKKKLYRLGTTMSFGCGEQESSVHLSGLNENLWASLELLRERFESPNTEADTLKKMAEVALGAHQDNKKDPQYIHRALGEFSRRGKESSILAELTDAEWLSLKTPELHKLTRKLLRHERRFSYIGNRPAGEIARLLETGERSFLRAPKRVPLRYQKPSAAKVLFAHRDMSQSQIGLFASDEIYNPARAVDYEYFRTVMGGGMSAVIFQEIREARSLAYAASGGYGTGSHKDDENQVWGYLGCQTDKTVEASSMLAELFKSPPITHKRFAEAAKAIEEGYRTNPIPFRGVPGVLLAWQDLGFTRDPRPERFARALNYSRAELMDFSKRFKDKPLTLYILGHKDRLDLSGVKKLGRDFEEKSLEQIFPY